MRSDEEFHRSNVLREFQVMLQALRWEIRDQRGARSKGLDRHLVGADVGFAAAKFHFLTLFVLKLRLGTSLGTGGITYTVDFESEYSNELSVTMQGTVVDEIRPLA